MIVVLSSCDRFPRDPERTLERALERGTLRLGVTDAPPWVIRGGDGEPRGVEAELLRSFAGSLGIDVEWRWGSAATNLQALQHGELDLVAAGLTKDDPWKSRVDFTMPYCTTRLVVAAPPGTSAPDDLDGVAVRAEMGSEAAGLLRERGARVLEVERLDPSPQLTAAEQWRLPLLGLRPGGTRLASRHHVMAARRGENATLMALEDHLVRHAPQAEVEAMLRDSEQRP